MNNSISLFPPSISHVNNQRKLGDGSNRDKRDHDDIQVHSDGGGGDGHDDDDGDVQDGGGGGDDDGIHGGELLFSQVDVDSLSPGLPQSSQCWRIE